MASIKDRKKKIADWLEVVDNEDILSNIEELMKANSLENYNRYIILSEQNTLENIVKEGEADIVAKRYMSHEDVKKRFLKK